MFWNPLTHYTHTHTHTHTLSLSLSLSLTHPPTNKGPVLSLVLGKLEPQVQSDLEIIALLPSFGVLGRFFGLVFQSDSMFFWVLGSRFLSLLNSIVSKTGMDRFMQPASCGNQNPMRKECCCNLFFTIFYFLFFIFWFSTHAIDQYFFF